DRLYSNQLANPAPYGGIPMTTAMPSSTIGTSQAELDDLLAELLPRQGQWDAEGYLWLTDHTNRLVEFTDGHIEVLPMPTDRHQTILEFLFLAFNSYLVPLGGKAHMAGIRLRVRAKKFREPDLIVLRSAKDLRRRNRYWKGA